MVGDNPKSDICGANSNGWHSILVRSGPSLYFSDAKHYKGEV